jgi:hypothetical protein
MKYIILAALVLSFFQCTPVFSYEFTARLTLNGAQDADFLRELDISVDSIRNNVARVWIDKEEERLIKEAGYSVEPILDAAFLKVDRFGRADGYHTPETCVDDLKAWAAEHKDVCSLHQIGTSVEGRPIVALKVSSNPLKHTFKPIVRICGAHHGNEVGSSETVIMFTKYLLDNYSTDARLRKLVEEREVWLIPMVNPDGVAKRTRYNGNHMDLNRNYGYHFGRGYKKAGSNPYSEPETRAIRDQAANIPFALSLSYHCSGDIVNYLWNYTKVRAPDQKLILELAEGYARTNGYEVTEGCDWYQTTGDTDDWAYGCTGVIDATIEVANPSFSGMPSVFNKNLESMLYTIEQAGRGICGIVTDKNSGKALEAMVEVLEPGWPAFTHPVLGDFHRVLQPGTYSLRVWAPGYCEKIIEGIKVGSGDATRIDVSLEEAPGNFHALKLMAAVIPQDNFKNTTHGPHSLGPVDGRFCSLGSGGYVVLDLSGAFSVGTAARLTITDSKEADSNDEAFEIFTSASCDGPFEKVGSGTGSCEVQVKSLQRYLKVVDNSNGKDAGTITPGLDLDAVTVELRPATQARQFNKLHVID